MKTERTWKDEVQERVQKRRTERAAGAEPLPLFPEEAGDGAGGVPPPAPVAPVSRSGASPVVPLRPARSAAPEQPVAPPRVGAAPAEVGDVDLRAPRSAPPAPGSPLDLPLQADSPAAAETAIEGPLDPAPEVAPAPALLLDESEPEEGSPQRLRLDWGPAPDPEDWPAPGAEDDELPVVERPATPEERLNAALLDALVIVAFWLPAVYLAGRAAQVEPLGLLPAWPGLLAFLGLLGLVYAAWFTGSTGQTPGKMLVGLRVVDRQGAPLGVARALARAALGVLGTALVGAGLWPMLFDPARRALHDRALQSRVIRG
jgi:uncharacterized RDD family membrane protein YckC